MQYPFCSMNIPKIYNGVEGVYKKRKHKAMTIEQKLNILDRLEAGETATAIGRSLNINESTVRSVRKAAGNIRRISRKTIFNGVKNVRRPIYERMEDALLLWLGQQQQQQVALSEMMIRTQAYRIQNKITENGGEGSRNKPFLASKGWFLGFLKRHRLKHISLMGDVDISLDRNVEDCKEALYHVIKDGGYSPDQIFCVDESGIYWKKMPLRTYFTQEEATRPGSKPSKDRATLLLSSNASGDLRLKPMLVYHSQLPRALKNTVLSCLPVLWRSNKKAWVTPHLFEDWFTNHAVPTIRAYCRRKCMSEKALFVVSSKGCHPQYLDIVHDGFRFFFLPPIPATHVNPMDQGIVAHFRRSYLRLCLQQMLSPASVSALGTSDDRASAAKTFWKEYNIKKGVTNISQCWEGVPQGLLNAAWQRLCPEVVTTSFRVNLKKDLKEIVHLGRCLPGEGFQDMSEGDVTELLKSHDKELTVEELLLASHEEPLPSDEDQGPYIQPITTSDLADALRRVDEVVSLLQEKDPLLERSAGACEAIQRGVEVYRRMYDARLVEEQARTRARSPWGQVLVSSYSHELATNEEPRTPTKDKQEEGSICHEKKQTQKIYTEYDSADECSENTNTMKVPERKVRPVRKKKGTFITGPDYVSAYRDSDCGSVSGEDNLTGAREEEYLWVDSDDGKKEEQNVVPKRKRGRPRKSETLKQKTSETCFSRKHDNFVEVYMDVAQDPGRYSRERWSSGDSEMSSRMYNEVDNLKDDEDMHFVAQEWDLLDLDRVKKELDQPENLNVYIEVKREVEDEEMVQVMGENK